jgi:ATP phosphoribosyltransferase
VIEVAGLSYSKTGEGNVKIVIAVHGSEPINDVKEIRPEAGSRPNTEPDPRIFLLAQYPGPALPFLRGIRGKSPDLMDVVVGPDRDGTTLRKNGLKIIGHDHGVAHVHYCKQGQLADPEKRRAIEEIKPSSLA